jgi:WD40 repeat protein
MQPADPCPTSEELESLLRGLAPAAALEPLARHLEHCDACALRAQRLGAEDTLEHALRTAAGTTPPPHGPEVQELIERLESLHPAALPTAGPPAAADGATPAPLSGPAAAYDFLAPAREPEEIGRIAHYRVLRLIGQGGMGMVFAAEDTYLRRPVALKVMKPALAADGTARQRFLREAQAAAAIRHEHIVTIYQVGEERGVVFLAMEFLQGEPLDRWLRRGCRTGPDEVVRLGREIAVGLTAAHAQGLIHRDVKPANVWLEALPAEAGDPSPRYRAKLLDFGLARTARDDLHLTRPGTVVGTPAYMAPEQARGEAVDARCDLYSLGCVLYRLCTGRLPFPADNLMALLTALATESPPAVGDLAPDVPPALAELVLRLLARDPADRPPSAQAVVEELRALEREVVAWSGTPGSRSGIEAPPADPTPTLPAAPAKTRPAVRASRLRHLHVAAAVLLGAGAVLAGLAVFRLPTDGGELIVEVDDPNVAVQLNKTGGVTLEDRARDRRYELRAGTRPLPSGEYEIVVSEPAAGLEFSTRQLTIRRGRGTTVRAWFRKPAGAGAAAAWQPGPADNVLHGLVARPAVRAGVGNWQVTTWFPRSEVYAVAWAPGGRSFACGTAAGEVRIYDARTLRLVRLLDGHTNIVQALAWSPDGRRLASGSDDQTVRLWDADGTPGPVLRGHVGPVFGVAWAPDGKRLATGSWDGIVRLWDADGTPGPTLPGHTGPIQRLAWAPDGKRLASAGGDGTVRLWQADGTPGPVLKGHDGWVYAVAFTPDGKRLASGGGDHTVRLWGADGTVGAVLKGHEDLVVSVAWSPDGTRLASASWDQTVRLWGADGTAGAVLRGHLGWVRGVAWAPDGKRLASAGSDQSVRLWEADGTPGAIIRGNVGWIHAASWHPDGRRLALALGDGTVRLWQADGTPGAVLKGHAGWVSAVAWGPDGKRLATSSADETVRLWRDDGTPGPVLRGHRGWVHGVAWRPDGRHLASAGQDETVRLWQANGTPGPVLKGHTGPVAAVAWGPDGRRLASASWDGTVRLWEADGRPGPVLKDSPEPVLSVAWSPDGKQLAAGSADGAVRLWQADGTPGPVLTGHTSWVWCVRWSPDGKRLASASWDQTARLWEANGNPGPVLRGGTSGLVSLAWGPDGGRLVAGSLDGALALWQVDPPQPQWSALVLGEGRSATFTAAGQVTLTAPAVEEDLVYVLEQPTGRLELVTPAQFRQRTAGERPPGDP